jgi:uncharacterized delta-60 repeat protein
MHHILFVFSKSSAKILAFVLALFSAQLAQAQCPMPANSQAGSLDTCFTQAGTGLNSLVNTLALQPDGKVLVGGYFGSYNGTARNYMCRLNADGTLDASFFPGTNLFVDAIALQPDGKILVGGEFTSYYGIPRNKICRLNSDGTLDAAFELTGTGLDSTVSKFALQPDGKILVGGRFSSYNGITRNRICRLNPDGSLDGTFAPTGSGLNERVFTLALQPDGKVLVGGVFTSYNGTARNRICRLNPDGSLDATFTQSGTGLNAFLIDLALQPDGKVLIGGNFTSYNGTARNYICRLNTDGSIDPSFAQTGSGFNGFLTLALQPDGKVIVGGNFTSYNGTPINRISRLNTNGSLDPTFLTGIGPDEFISSLALQPDGKIFAGGFFRSYNGTRRRRLVRLFGGNVTAAKKPLTPTEISLYPNPAQTHITLRNEVAMPYKLVSTTCVVWQEGIAQPGASLPVTNLPQGVYSLVLTRGQSVVVKRFVKE